MEHTPVLLGEVLRILDPKPGEVVLDVTVGLGGHAAAFLEVIGPRGKFVGMDADGENLEAARKVLEPWKGQVELWQGNFMDLQVPRDGSRLRRVTLRQAQDRLLRCEAESRASNGRPAEHLTMTRGVDILFADLGLSSPHVDDPSRGFTFREDAPLDMRFDRERGETAAEFLQRISEQELAGVFREYGELRGAGRLAMAIKDALQGAQPRGRGFDSAHHDTRGWAIQSDTPFTTFALKKVVEEVYGWRAKAVLPQVFQALRIAVNDELGALQVLLQEAPKFLKPGGRMGIISYHSLEDRMVKQAFRMLCTSEKDLLTGAVKVEAPFGLLTKKPIRPSDDEIRRNPRARSAKFRALCSTAPS